MILVGWYDALDMHEVSSFALGHTLMWLLMVNMATWQVLVTFGSIRLIWRITMLKILVGNLVSMATTSIVAGCLNSVAGVAWIPLLLISTIAWFIVTRSCLSHVLISILSTQSSRSTICSYAIPLYFIHYHFHIFTFLGGLNSTDLVASCALIYKTLLHLHRTGNFGISLSSVRHLLEMIINVYLRASSLTLNVLVEVNHLWRFCVQLVHNLSGNLVPKELVFVEISIHVFQLLLDQLIFHYVSFDTRWHLAVFILMY